MLRLSLALLFLSQPLQAKAPRVVTDIAPVHALVSQVMAGVGTPELLVNPGVSPHGYSLRPSQARGLQQAELVFWIGEILTPWLGTPLENLANDAVKVALHDADGTIQLPYRNDHNHNDDHGHNDHDSIDPHMWLDPENAKIWYDLIADELARINPENTALYRTNADTGKARLSALSAKINARLAPLQARGFLVFHDSFQYYETRFNLSSRGAISLGDGSAPNAARLSNARETVAQQGIVCVFSEPQFNASVVTSVIEGTDVKTAVLDPLGINVTIGKDLYMQVLRGITTAFVDCLK